MLKTFRGWRRLSQPELAQASGLSAGFIGMVETSKRGLQHDSIEAISNALGLDDEQRRAIHDAARHFRQAPKAAATWADIEAAGETREEMAELRRDLGQLRSLLDDVVASPGLPPAADPAADALTTTLTDHDRRMENLERQQEEVRRQVAEIRRSVEALLQERGDGAVR